VYFIFCAQSAVALLFYNGVFLFWAFATTLVALCFVGVIVGNVSHKILLLPKFDCISKFHSMLLSAKPLLHYMHALFIVSNCFFFAKLLLFLNPHKVHKVVKIAMLSKEFWRTPPDNCARATFRKIARHCKERFD